ncbi:Hypothetical predicted protein [Octopus vulgaris]|uniref:Uncharacterized protein n=1 Tax=Octopus vulgaris TaxID=6645 RepID=A0AA36F030_OCTVU|nr:Hypothetical predicted protein [Octopus vulgaris]
MCNRKNIAHDHAHKRCKKAQGATANDTSRIRFSNNMGNHKNDSNIMGSTTRVNERMINNINKHTNREETTGGLIFDVFIDGKFVLNAYSGGYSMDATWKRNELCDSKDGY